LPDIHTYDTKKSSGLQPQTVAVNELAGYSGKLLRQSLMKKEK